MDIMMGRVLSAAKHMISESPQHPTMKQPVAVVQEPPREVFMVVNNIKPHLVKLQQPDPLCHHIQNKAGQSGVPISSIHRSQVESTCATCAEFFGRTREVDVVNALRLKGGQQITDSHVDNLIHNREYQKLYGSPLYTRLQGTAGVSSYQNNHYGNPKTADNYRKKELDPQSKGPCIIQQLFATDQDECRLPSTFSVAEKTLYIDPVHKLESQNSQRSPSKESFNCKEDGCSTIYKHTEVKDLSFQDSKHLNGANVSARSTPNTSPKKINHDMQIDMNECPRPKVDVYRGSQVLDERKIDLERRVPKIPDKDSTNGTSAQLPLPPLPKSPSESWLQRTLPTLSLKNSYMKNWSSKSPFGPKWETLVKTSNTHHGHLQFSEEQLTPIPEV